MNRSTPEPMVDSILAVRFWEAVVRVSPARVPLLSFRMPWHHIWP